MTMPLIYFILRNVRCQASNAEYKFTLSNVIKKKTKNIKES